MGKQCVVRGCSTGAKAEVKRRKLLQKKPVALFGIPKAPRLADAWARAIGSTFALTENHYVCELHFRNDDVITNFVHTMPSGQVVSIERERHALRMGAIPVSHGIVKQPQSAEIVNDINDDIVKSCAGSSSQRRTKKPERCLDASTSQAGDDDREPQSPVYHSDSSYVDSLEYCNDEDEEITAELRHDARAYNMDNLVTDLAKSKWRERWVWSRTRNEIVFVHLNPVTLEPRLYYSIKNDFTATLSLPDRINNITVDYEIRAFSDLIEFLTGLETMKECAGTGREEEKRSRNCSLFVDEDETYARDRPFQRCFKCRELRQKVFRRTHQPTVTTVAKNSKIDIAVAQKTAQDAASKIYGKLKANNNALATDLAKEKQERQYLFAENIRLTNEVQELKLAYNKPDGVISVALKNDTLQLLLTTLIRTAKNWSSRRRSHTRG